MSYRDRSQKQITLPSGATVVIRKLSAFENFDLFGDSKAKESETELGIARVRYALLHCCGPLSFEGETLRIVDRAWNHEPVAGEITIEELDQADAETIFAELMTLSGLTKEAAAKAKTFRESQQEGNGSGSHAGEVLRDAAVSGAAVVP